MRILLAIIVFTLALHSPASVQGQQDIAGNKNNADSEKVLLSKIRISGNKVTRRSIILREMSVKEGDHILKSELKEVTELNRKRIFNLALFTEVLMLIDSTIPGTVEWEIIVKEQWYIIPEFTFKLADRNFNVWWVEQNRDIRRANIGMTLKHRNFRGNLERVGATAQIGYTQKFGLEYERPYVDRNQKHGFGFKFFVSRNEEWYYTTDSNKWEFASTRGTYITDRFEAAGSYTYRPAYASRHLVELRYRQQAVRDTMVELNKDYFLDNSKEQKYLELLYRYDLNLVDNWNYPLHGTKAVLHSILRVGIQGFDWQNQYQAEVGFFQKYSSKVLTSFIFRGRLSFPELQPYTHVYAMGTGNEYVRGYEYYVIDGSHYGILRSNLKYELLNFKIRKLPIKYIATIPIRVYPKIYTDVGYGRNKFPGNSTLNNRPIYSAGGGVDIVSVYDFKLRIEYTVNHLGEKGLFLHFTSE